MRAPEVIAALQIGLEEAVSLIEFLSSLSEDTSEDPQINNTIENLKRLIVYSQHVEGHPLYDN